jgi:MFS family permease
MAVSSRQVVDPPAPVAEEEEAHDLEHPLALPRVDVADVPELLHEPALDAGFLRHFADGRLRSALAPSDQPLRQRPDVLSPRPDGGEVPAAAQAPDHDPAGRELPPHVAIVSAPKHPDGIVRTVRRLLLLVCAIVLVDTMLYAALAPLLPEYEEEFGLSKGEAGLLVGAYAGGVLLGAIPGGLAAARYGPKRAVLVGLGLIAAASIGFGFADEAVTLGVCRLAQGTGSALSWAGGLAWLVAGTPRHRRGEMLGTAIGSAIFGALLGPAVGAAAEAAGAVPVFLGVAGLAAGLAFWALQTPGAEAEPQSPGTLLRAPRDPVLLGGLWLVVLPALLFGVVSVLVPLELGRAGWGAAAIAAAFIGSAALEMFVAPAIGRFSDRRGRLVPVRFALLGGAVVSAALALADGPGPIVVLLVAAAVAFGAFWAPAMALVADASERIGLGQGLGFGLMNAAWGTGNSFGPSLGGALADAVGDALPFGLMALVCLTTLFLVARRPLLGTRPVRVPEGT